ncbi:MAG TPA: cyclic lactone autoinducer peptide [Desulfotomaculum sp.]|nr:cyclic lactone autoinducer peptide [Desulfotomaculum sp.]
MKRIAYTLFMFAVTGLVLLASISSASACLLGHYQPQVPKSLQK